jgi:GntR family transcriptional regulator/MocR family aminotransferase
LLLRLDGEGSLYRQAFRALRAAIRDGQLAAGARLPSTRSLAQDAKLSRNTVLQAYEDLVSEGYAVSRGGAGTFVASQLPDAHVSARSLAIADTPMPREPGAREAPLSKSATRALDYWGSSLVSWRFERPRLRFDFRYGEPAFDDFPLATWSRLLDASARSISRDDLGYGDPAGDPDLRRALARYLGRARGVDCDADQIIVVYGTQQAIDLSIRVLVDPGTRVAVEEPGYRGFHLALAAAGAERVPITVDDQGLDVAALEGESDVALVCTTPSHQFPTGVVMPVERRLQLLEWANRSGSYLLEDDYDSEFRFDGPPIECLQGLDHAGRVIYSGTLSKVMFPSLRLGYLVPPRELRPAILAAKVMSDAGCGGIEQRAMAAFIDQGHFDTHLRRTRTRAARKREVMLESLARHFGDRVRVTGANAGLHVMLRLAEQPAARVGAICRQARERDVGVYPARSFFMRPPDEAVLLLGYGALDEGAIREGVKRLAAVIDAQGRGR